ncbi:MAG: hypothetical protein RBU37_19905 [Myxococcota bacterium]|jgi:hypothetical protein|nr:hypothetical protein [Myxococcota bacterium]
MARNVIFDERFGPSLPIVTVQGEPSDAEVRGFLTRSELAYSAKVPYAAVFVLEKLTTLSMAQRRSIAAHLREHRSELQELCVGQAYVMSSVLARMILRTIFSIQPQPAPWTIVSEVNSGIQYCVQRLRLSGLEVPADALSLISAPSD